MENEMKELTLFDILKRVFKHKIILISITLVITILGTLFLGVFYSKDNATYSTSFTLTYPKSESSIYPDGSNLIYTDFISEDNLQIIKNNKLEEYKSIDIEEMSLRNDISISQTTKDTKTVYTVTIKQKYFNNRELAKKFLTDIASLPILKIIEMAQSTSHDDFINAYTSEIRYENKLELLETQKNFLIESYNKAIESYGNLTLQKDDTSTSTLMEYKQSIVNYFSWNSISLLSSYLTVKGYAPENKELEKIYLTQKSVVEFELDIIKNLIETESLQNSNTPGDYVTLAYLQEEQIKLEKEIKTLDNKIKFANGDYPTNLSQDEKLEYESFKNDLDEIYNKILYFLNEYAQNIEEIYETSSFVSFTTTSVITEDNSIGIFGSIVISCIVGFILACFCSLIYHEVKRRKKS